MTKSTNEIDMCNLPLFGELLARKLVVHSRSSMYFAVERFLFADLISSQIVDVSVDEAWYVETYPDVKGAIEQGLFPNAKYHYIKFGYFENRMPRSIQVEELWYMNMYPDVKAAISSGTYESAQEHFEVCGFSEGRLPYAKFSLLD